MAKKKSTTTAAATETATSTTLGGKIVEAIDGAEIVREKDGVASFKLNGKTFKVERANQRTTVTQLFGDGSKKLIYSEVMMKYEIEESLLKARPAIITASK